MEISLIEVDHEQQKAYVEFHGESINANIDLTISDLNVLEDLIRRIRAILIEGTKHNAET
jgi:hypothetical protein